MLIQSAPNLHEKLSLLSQSSQYDLACACGSSDADRRHRSKDDQWIYPVTMPDGRKTFLFKTLISNACINDCAYCPFRTDNDPRRCTIEADELVSAFMAYYRAGKVSGLFVSSGVTGSPDATMERINRVAALLRYRERFRGYIHLKIIPGASDAAIQESVSLASAVSLNIEVPGETHFSKLSARKNYLKDVIQPIQLISRLTEKGGPHSKVSHTTQFVVGASTENDRELVHYTGALYDKLQLDRIFFSSYQRGSGRAGIPGETSGVSNKDLLTREHRLYQVDFLLRKYRFKASEIPIDDQGFLSLTSDPKEVWARQHPESFPVNINRADKWELLRVPGLGPLAVSRLMLMRKNGCAVRTLEQINKGRMNKRLLRALSYVRFG